ncbi:hypothetical protein ZWY2020_026082 [Hordeum vulgare]|nr:hypothetical protein ZWY2020_026082 [Hordeum vulgare]
MAAQMAADAACDERENKRANTGSQCWSATFPEDLLVLIYTMIASPRGRSCFAAACRSWRAAAHAAPPVPALPRLLFSHGKETTMKALYCLEDGAFMHLKVPEIIIGGHDSGWIAGVALSGLVRIVNLFSGAEVALDEKKATIVCPSPHHARGNPVVISRVVFSAAPTSSLCILAAVTQNCGIALCKIGCPNNGWAVQGCHNNNRQLVDITFCNGKLYGLYSKRKLVRFEIRVGEGGAPRITAEHRLVMRRIDRTIRTDDYRDIASYIFNLDGKLAMALKARWLPNIPPFFKVFKLVDIHMVKSKTHYYKDKWMEVTSLGDQSLFLGKSFSKAVHVPANMCGLVERNRIYYSHYCWFGINTNIPSDKVFLKISNGSGSMTCYKEDDSKNTITDDDDAMKRIMSVGYFMQGGLHGGMWIFPPNMHLV